MNKSNPLITRRFTFSSAHRMWNKSLSTSENNRIFGMCQNVHGHNYVLEVTVGGKIDHKTQCVVNLNTIKNTVDKKIILLIDHQYLNDVLLAKNVAKDLPVTLENLGFWVWKILDQEFKKQKINLFSIRIWESENNSVTFFKK